MEFERKKNENQELNRQFDMVDNEVEELKRSDRENKPKGEDFSLRTIMANRTEIKVERREDEPMQPYNLHRHF